MNFIIYLETKLYDFLFYIAFSGLTILLLSAAGFQQRHLLLYGGITVCAWLFFQWLRYRRQIKKREQIMDLADSLDEAWYAAEVLPKPKEFDSEAYYHALKIACKAMSERLDELEEEQQDYREYIESFAHEIKVPISALSLTFDNTKNYELKKETDTIFNLVEQMLYYARSENTEKDYFVRRLNLQDAVHDVILKFRRYLMDAGVELDICTEEIAVFTDEKWLGFILSQIIQNSIKYFDKQKKLLSVYCRENTASVSLVIEDNGCGISASDLLRVFEKGFTGSDRSKSVSTGMGLYLAKTLCDRLGLGLTLESREGEFTRVTIVFPKGTVHEADVSSFSPDKSNFKSN